MNRIYLDDVRTPVEGNWIVVRNYQEFVDKVNELGLDNIELVSLDHDLGDTAMAEYFNNVSKNYKLDYFLVDVFYDNNVDRFQMNRRDKKDSEFKFPTVYVHSANPIGAANIMGYINNFYMNEGQPQTCVRVQIPHTTDF